MNGLLAGIADLLGVASLIGTAYLLAGALAVRRFAGAPARRSSHRPPVSMLKPLHGGEFELLQNFLSFCDQRYPERQIVFGVYRRRWAAWPGEDVDAVHRYQIDCPGRRRVGELGSSDR